MSTPPRDLLALAEAIDARLHDAASSARTAIIAEVMSAHEALAHAGGDWVLVPREPTREMCQTYDAHVWLIGPYYEREAARVYRAMIAAAPATPGGDDVVPPAPAGGDDALTELTRMAQEDGDYDTPTREAAHDAERVERVARAMCLAEYTCEGTLPITPAIQRAIDDDWSTRSRDARAALAAIAPEVRG